MTDREKVINALECCIDPERPKCYKCPEQGPGFGYACRDNVWTAALALLKAQEPRVMTLEEALGGDECWIDGRSGACGYGDALLTDDGERVDFYRPHRIDTLDFYEYGLSWRCWTSRPTDAQREAEPWSN